MRIFIPDLYERLFDPTYVSPDDAKSVEEGIFFPTTEEDFEAMMHEFDMIESEERSKAAEEQRRSLLRQPEPTA